MMKPPERIEVPEPQELRERFARLLAILIVVSTLGVASIEFLHSDADRNADHAGVEAQRLGVERQGELVRADDAARTQIEAFAYSAAQRASQGNAFQQFLLPSVVQGSAEAKLLNLEETRWSQLAALTGQLTDIKPDTVSAPTQDPRFPNLELAARQHESNRLFALQDASNQLRGDWQTRVGFLSVILTLFAVAIYLFGLSLTLQAGVRRLLVGLGLLLVAVGGVWAVALQFSSPSAAPEEAASAYADGVAALSSFYTQPGDSGLKAADAAFTKAIELRPRFSNAYVQRSQVRFLLGSPQRDSAVVSLTTADALRAQGDDLQAAYDLGDRDKLLLNNLAANRLVTAIGDRKTDDFRQALGFLDAAIKLDANDPLLYFNRGLGQLGLGDTGAARSAYQLGVDHTRFTDVNKRTARNDPAAEESYLGGALTALDLLARQRTDLAAAAATMKELIVKGIDDPSGSPAGKAQLSDAAIQVFGGELQWTGTLTGYDANSDEVSTQWYYQAPSKLGWAVLDPISGDSTPAPNSAGGANGYFYIQRYLQAAGQCLQAGSYRAEIYVDGHLVAQPQSDAALPALSAARLPDVGISICHPQDWKQDTTNVLQGFSTGLVNADHTAGAYALRFQNPGTPPGTDPLVEARSYRDEFFQLPGFLPAGTTPQIAQETSIPYFLGLHGANEAYYTDGNGGYIRIGSGVTDDGAVIVGVVFGPKDQWAGDHTTGDAIFDSMIALG